MARSPAAPPPRHKRNRSTTRRGVISASDATSVSAGNLTNAAGQISGDTVAVNATTLDTHDGQIVGVRYVTVSATGDLNNAAGTIGSQEGNATVTAGGRCPMQTAA